jgi:mannitol-1-phosphate/altronate dehydrogenase
MTKEEQAVIDAAMAWLDTRFSEYQSKEKRAFTEACVDLRTSRISQAQLDQIQRDVRAYKELQDRVYGYQRLVGEEAFEALTHQAKKAIEEKAEVEAWTTEKLKAYTGRGDL